MYTVPPPPHFIIFLIESQARQKTFCSKNRRLNCDLKVCFRSWDSPPECCESTAAFADLHRKMGHISEGLSDILRSIQALPGYCCDKLRPISGSVATRSKRHGDQEQRHGQHTVLCPLQMGVCVKNGAESIVLTADLMMKLKPDWVLVQTDLSNAYGNISRIALRKRLTTCEAWRHLVPLFDLVYGK